ncbi:Uncharacterised protein [Mycobacteroides abscessus subsp. abscessus]|nr:Uncharacterised protein [Mycobacteroides abscessus subsp. abscessus]
MTPASPNRRRRSSTCSSVMSCGLPVMASAYAMAARSSSV